MTLRCSYAGCFYAEERICSRSGSGTPCEYASESEVDVLQELAHGDPNADQQVDVGATKASNWIHTGQELGLDEAGELMGESYTHLISVLGEQDSGKTSLLLCLYFACACGQMADIDLSFAGSVTLPGFEARSRSTRRWNEIAPPNRMTERTSLGADRGGGFLHLDLVRNLSRQRLRILISDLPGEWTKNLIDSGRHAERLQFARRSDALLVMLDGSSLESPDARQVTLYRTETLLQRLPQVLGGERPRLFFLVTRADICNESVLPLLNGCLAIAETLGFRSSVHSICTFSQNPTFSSGHGILDVFNSILSDVPRRSELSIPRFTKQRRIFGWAPMPEAK